MRRREGGTGCGTRERGQRKATSPGGGGEPSRGTKTAGRSDRSVEGVKPEMPRGAPSWRGASADAPGPGDPGPPGVIVRAVRRNPDNASSRRVTPLMGKEKETGLPRARPKGGASDALAFCSVGSHAGRGRGGDANSPAGRSTKGEQNERLGLRNSGTGRTPSGDRALSHCCAMI